MLNVKKTLTKIMEYMDKIIITRTYSISSISSSTYYSTVTKDITVAGYTPIAFTRININQAAVYLFSFVAANTASFGIANRTGGSISGAIINFDVIYIRSDLIG